METPLPLTARITISEVLLGATDHLGRSIPDPPALQHDNCAVVAKALPSGVIGYLENATPRSTRDQGPALHLQNMQVLAAVAYVRNTNSDSKSNELI